MEIHICSITEYDSQTRVPTIVNPDSSTFYLVPSEDGTSPDLFTEWVYVNNAWEMFGNTTIDLSGYLTDVQINNSSIVSNGVATIPIGNSETYGVFKTNSANGISNDNGTLAINNASESDIKGGTEEFKPLTPNREHIAVFYGLAKVSGTDEKNSILSIGQYTDEAKTSIQNMLDVPSKSDIPDVPIEDVQIDGTSILSQGVANLPIAVSFDTNTPGLFKFGNGFISNRNTKKTDVAFASSSAIKDGLNTVTSISPSHQHEAAFYGLAKAAGDTTQASSDNTVGTYTDSAKSSIQTMLGLNNVIKNTDYASSNTAGVVKIDSDWGIGIYDPTWSGGSYGNFLYISPPNPAQVKAGSSLYKAITPGLQHQAVFYGLAKAAGDTTQSSSSNAVGIYTESAKSSISEMLNSSIAVSGTAPTIVAKAGIRYVCGEVLTLDITVPSTGIIDVIFTSGSSPTVLTITPPTGMTMKWANNFDPAILEANATYEINIMDGYLGVVGKWT